MLSGYDFRTGPWQNVEWLIKETEKFYTENVTPKGLGDRFTVACSKIVEHRKWQPTRRIFEKNLLPVIRELGIFYVPKQMDPGPAIIFPQRDITGRFTHGKIWPLYPLILHDKPVKYSNLGDKNLVQGPNWFGNTDVMLATAMRTRTVFLVEGFFDLLACRLAWPGTPVLSNGTKSISDDHLLYLRMLGIERVCMAFDNEAPKGEKTIGAGNQAMQFFARKFGKVEAGPEFRIVRCPNDDPSLCLENVRSTLALKEILVEILTDISPESQI